MSSEIAKAAVLIEAEARSVTAKVDGSDPSPRDSTLLSTALSPPSANQIDSRQDWECCVVTGRTR